VLSPYIINILWYSKNYHPIITNPKTSTMAKKTNTRVAKGRSRRGTNRRTSATATTATATAITAIRALFTTRARLHFWIFDKNALFLEKMVWTKIT
jgi:hypothetical protein